jgi:hypothetical protein
MRKANPIEAALFHSYWDDGLLDILAGVGLLGVGVGWAVDLPVLGAVVPALLVPLWLPLRRRIVEPRVGFVEFSQARQHRVARGLYGALGLGVVVLVAALGSYFWIADFRQGSVATTLVPGLPAALLALLAVLTGLLTGAQRFGLYGVALVFAAAATILMNGGPAAPMLAGGGLVLCSGIALLVRFLADSADYTAEAQ